MFRIWKGKLGAMVGSIQGKRYDLRSQYSSLYVIVTSYSLEPHRSR